MDVFQMITIYYPDWSPQELLLIENILNLFLLFPVGILLPIFLDRKMPWWQGLLVGLLISAVVEILQLLMCRGLFEFDDMIHNGFGCMLGTVIVGRWKIRKESQNGKFN